MIEITKKLSTNSDCYKTNKKITIKGIVVHSTACPGRNAEYMANGWNKPGQKACVHAHVDDKNIIQTLEWNHRGWHAGSGTKGSYNDSHIGFEISEPAGIVYNANKSGIIEYDTVKQTPYFNAIYKNAIDLCTYLCKIYNLTEKDIVCHSEAHARGYASNHGDVMHWFPKHGKNMDTFRAEVKKLLEGSTPQPDPIQIIGKYTVTAKDGLQVRTGPGTSYTALKTLLNGTVITVNKIENNWAKSADTGGWSSMDYLVKVADPEPEKKYYRVQVGAYKVKANADNMLKKVKDAGFADAYIPSKIDDYYRVQIGAYTIKANADSTLNKLKEKGFTGYVKYGE